MTGTVTTSNSNDGGTATFTAAIGSEASPLSVALSPVKPVSVAISPTQRRRQNLRAAAAAVFVCVWFIDAVARRLMPQGHVALVADLTRAPLPTLPLPLFAATQYGKLYLERAVRALQPLPQTVASDMFGFTQTALLHAVCELGVPGSVSPGGDWTAQALGVDRGTSAAEVAERIGVSTHAAERIMSALSAIEYVTSVGFGRWMARPPLAALRGDWPGGSMCPFVTHNVELGWRAWAHLHAAIVNPAAHPHALGYGGLDIWGRLDTNPRLNALMTSAMATIDGLMSQPLVDDGPWGRYDILVDIGGASGSFLSRIVAANGYMSRGIVFDRPAVIQGAERAWRAAADLAATGGRSGGCMNGNASRTGVADYAPAPGAIDPALRQRVGKRLAFAGGSLFNASTLPQLSELANSSMLTGLPPRVGYLMRLVLHDFSDAECAAILRNVRSAMAPDPHAVDDSGGDLFGTGTIDASVTQGLLPRLLLVEQVVEETRDPAPFRGLEDLHMMAVTAGGRERTRREWEVLLEQGGFKLERVGLTRSLLSVLTAVPI